MKKPWVWLSLAMPRIVAACGAGDDDHGAQRPFGVAGIIGGIWNGNVQSNLTGRNTGSQTSANIAANGPFFSGSGTIYHQRNCDDLFRLL
jgi:hypothetical protein